MPVYVSSGINYTTEAGCLQLGTLMELYLLDILKCLCYNRIILAAIQRILL